MTREEFIAFIEMMFPDNIKREITEAKLRDVSEKMANLCYDSQDIASSAAGTVQQPITPTSAAPTITNGYWAVTIPGTYTNFGNVVLPENNFGFIFKNGSSFTIQSVEMPIQDLTPLENKISELENIANIRNNFKHFNSTVNPIVTYNGVVLSGKDADDKLLMADKAIKAIRVLNNRSNQFYLIRQFVYNATSKAFQFIVRIVNDTNDYNLDTAVGSIPTDERLLIFTGTLTQNKHTLYCVQSGSNSVLEVEIDVTNITQTLSINFRNGGAANNNTSGLNRDNFHFFDKKSALQNSEITLTDSAVSGVTTYAGTSMRMYRALKNFSISASKPIMARLSQLNYKAGISDIQIQIFGADLNTSGVITSASIGYFALRLNIPTTDTGVKTYEFTTVTDGGSNVKAYITLDVNEFSKNLFTASYNSASLSNNLANFFYNSVASGGGSSTLTSLVVATKTDFYNIGKDGSAIGSLANRTGYDSTALILLPVNANKISILGNIDQYANVGFFDDEMHIIKWAQENSDGTKYSEATVISNPIYDIPNGSKFTLITQKTADVTNFKLTALGQNIPNETKIFRTYKNVTEMMSDKNYIGLAKAGNFLLEKNSNADLDYSVIGSNTNLKNFTASNEIIFELQDTGGLTVKGGALCDVKNGVMYIVNTPAKCVYKTADNGQTFTIISDRHLHPELWELNGQSDDRNFCRVMDNEELLIQFRINKPKPEGSNIAIRTFYAMYRTSNNQSQIHKCFEFSNESFLQDWNSSASNFGWTLHSSGCQLGDWTFRQRDNFIVMTEYGKGSSEYLTRLGVSSNGRGVSSRVWVSFDYGVNWAIALDVNKRKRNDLEKDDANWFYFPHREGKEYCHMHCLEIDNYNNKVYVTNGDGWDNMWSISISTLESWFANAVMVNPEVSPVTSLTDSHPAWEWSILNYKDGYTAALKGKTTGGYTAMQMQHTAILAIANGHVLGHDMPREFGYFAHRNQITPTNYVCEPTQSLEFRADFDSDASFEASKLSTDGFVMGLYQPFENGTIYMCHSGANRNRIYASSDGLKWQKVLDSPKAINFGCRLIFDNNKVFFFPIYGTTNIQITGYFELTY